MYGTETEVGAEAMLCPVSSPARATEPVLVLAIDCQCVAYDVDRQSVQSTFMLELESGCDGAPLAAARATC